MLVSKVSQLPSAIMTKSLLFLVFSALSVQACLSYEVTGKKSKSAWKKCHKGFFCRDLSNEMQHYCWSTLCFSIQRQPSEAFHIVWKSPKMSNCVFFAPKFKYIAEKLVIEILFLMRLFWWFSYNLILLVEGRVFSFYQTFSFHLQGPWGQPVCKFAMPH